MVVESTKHRWKVQEHLKGLNPNSLALDSKNSRAYCGTFDNGLWKTDDNGHTWDETSLNISGCNIMSLATSSMEKGEKGFDKLFVGMEPSLI